MTPKERAMDSVKTDAKWKLVPVEPTPEMIEAGDVANPTAWNEDTDLGFGCDVAFEVYRAMLAASPAGAEVRVKPLVWVDEKETFRGKTAVTVVGTYQVRQFDNGFTLTFDNEQETLLQAYKTEAEALAKAQEDCTSRILRAVEPTPSTDAVRRQAREEALEGAVRYLASGFRIGELRDDVRAIVEEIRARALSTPPAGAAALNEGEE